MNVVLDLTVYTIQYVLRTGTYDYALYAVYYYYYYYSICTALCITVNLGPEVNLNSLWQVDKNG